MFCIPTGLPNRCRAIWALVALVVLAFPSVSSACSCQRTGFDDFPHVFLIRVISVEDRGDRSYASRIYDQGAWDPESFGVRVRYAVEHIIKGNLANVPFLTSNYGGSDCGVLLGATPGERQADGRALVIEAVPPDETEAICRHLQQHPFGPARLRQAIEAQVGRPCGPRRIGRPPKGPVLPTLKAKLHSDPGFMTPVLPAMLAGLE